MSTYERPGVYSSYDASTIISGSGGGKTVGVAAVGDGTAGEAVTITSGAGALTAFGEGSSAYAIISSLFKNGASGVVAVAVETVDGAAGSEQYSAAFSKLAAVDGISLVVCDSSDEAVQLLLKESVETCSAARRERIAVVDMADASVDELIARAAAINSERVVLVAPAAYGSDGSTLCGAGVLAAAAAGVISGQSDPALPVSGAEIKGFGGLARQYDDNDINLLVRGGVTPVECVSGRVSVVRAVTTRTMSSGVQDTTWRELSTILVVDDVIPSIRSSLRARFARSKNNAQSRAAIRTQVILELENKLAAEIIDGYDSVTVEADAEDPGVCNVDFGFAVAHGLNQIYLSAHITV